MSEERCIPETDVMAEPMPAPTNNKIRSIFIEELGRGYVVKVGCQSFAFSTKEEMVIKLTDYINDPGTIEKLWNSGKLF